MMMQRSNVRRPRGIATAMVISSMIFIAAAVTGMTAVAAHEARRTRGVQAETQLRQVLLAALPLAQRELAANSAAHDVTVNVPVDGAMLVLHIVPAGSGQVQVVVQAGYRGFKGSQTLVLSRAAAGEWQVNAATLGQTGGQ